MAEPFYYFLIILDPRGEVSEEVAKHLPQCQKYIEESSYGTVKCVHLDCSTEIGERRNSIFRQRPDIPFAFSGCYIITPCFVIVSTAEWKKGLMDINYLPRYVPYLINDIPTKENIEENIRKLLSTIPEKL